jgi:hypothetical protein
MDKKTISAVIFSVVLFLIFGVYMVRYSRAIDEIMLQESCRDILHYAEIIPGYEEEFKRVVERCRAVEN